MAIIEAKTSLGTYIGIQDHHPEYTIFKGIPYARAPIGELRWKKPVPAAPFKGKFIADTFGTISCQLRHEIGSFYQKEFFEHQEAMSEDSLFLNIWTPAQTKEDKLPVLIWIHGGAYTGGYGHEPEFDGKAFNKNGVILVTINYRLGIFGFMSHPWLQSEGEFGNFGIYDQIEAIRFVHEHIAAFGGDPDNITIMGQSAGARSVQIICSSPKTKRLFAKAIFQSGAGTHSICQEITQQKQALQMAKMIEALGYHSLDELKAAPYKVLIHDINEYIAREGLNILEILGPNIDGDLLLKSCDEILQEGSYHDIPYMIGSTKNELFSPETAIAIANSSYGFATLQSAQHQSPIYVYYFEKDLPGDDAGAFHSGELWYEFGTLKRCWRPFNKEDEILSQKMNLYWSEFIKKGNPNHPELTEWKNWTEKKKTVLCLNTEIYTKEIQ